MVIQFTRYKAIYLLSNGLNQITVALAFLRVYLRQSPIDRKVACKPFRSYRLIIFRGSFCWYCFVFIVCDQNHFLLDGLIIGKGALLSF